MKIFSGTLILFGFLVLSGCQQRLHTVVILQKNWIDSLKPGVPKGLILQPSPDDQFGEAVIIQSQSGLTCSKKMSKIGMIYVDQLFDSEGNLLSKLGDWKAGQVVVSQMVQRPNGTELHFMRVK